ncbi:heparin lyase I family protein [Endozoicomonas sp. GU-1]|uniref:heparin lyase I family protein n=1 Tax=Endozoicomonas sp. GU-1 TaxID=3009078 RepID=UPI0022B30301|nr:heparin lyase I family protein [Endozoicomonas sp. GU-1]WBA82862.1 heparin lyase I family protein [Endozoicomonas sp. GU-1]WBA85790.1 heparin lyase I family protein [Endozoicomonas sp. GU-1]
MVGNIPTSSLTEFNSNERSDNFQGQFNSRIVSDVGDALKGGLASIGSALKNAPNPLYYLTKYPGRILATILLSSRSVTDANPLPDNSTSLQLRPTPPIKDWNKSTFDNGDFPIESSGLHSAHLMEIEKDGGEASHQALIDSLEKGDDPIDNDSVDSAVRNRRSTNKKKTRWTDVPLVKDHNRPLLNSELTMDGQFARVGNPNLSRLKQKPSQKAEGITYRFELRDFRDNTLKKGGQNTCPPESSGNKGCKGRVELTSCFFKSGEVPDYSRKQLAFLKESKAYLNDCPGSVPMGGVFSVSMDLMVEQLGEAIIFQIHGKPDRWLYRSEVGNENYLLSPASSAKAYTTLVKDNMKFEQGGYPPLSLSLEKHKENYYLALMARSEYVPYNDKSQRCNLKFSNYFDGTSQTKCCNGERDVSYLFSTKIGNNDTDLNVIKNWANLKFEIKTSNYSGSEATPGHVRMWVNDAMKVNAVTYIGRNDAPHRGGGNMYGKFGIYRTSSDQPIAIRFKHVNMQIGVLQPKPQHEIDNTTVSGGCQPELKPYCEVPETQP